MFNVCKHTLLFEAIDQPYVKVFTQCNSQDRCNRICVCVKHHTIGMRQRSEYRNHTLFEQEIQQRGIHTFSLNVADKAVIYFFHGPAYCAYQVSIRTSYTQCLATEFLQLRDNLFINKSAINHRDQIKCFRIRYSPSVDIVRFNTKLLTDTRRDFSTPVNQYAGLFDRSKVSEKPVQSLRLVEYVPSDLDDK